MRVVYLNPTGEIGGAEASLLTLITALREERPDFDPYLITTAEGALTRRCAEIGIPHRILELPDAVQKLGDAPMRAGLEQKVGSSLRLLRNGALVGRYMTRLSKVLGAVQPDLLHSNGLKMHLMAAMLCGHRAVNRIPLVGHIHDYVSRRPLAGKLLRQCSGRFHWFVANSESVARDVRSFLKTDRVCSIYNAVDTSRYAPLGPTLDLDAQCGLSRPAPGTVRVGLSATFAKWKGHLVYLQALAALDPQLAVRGYVIGGPIYRTAGSQFSVEQLKAEADRLGLQGRVGFTGLLADTGEALRALDIAVHASTDPEPFGLAIVEAMSCAKAMIVSNAGGAAELFEEGVTGLGHRPGDVADLAEQIGRLVLNPSLRASLGRAARERVVARFATRDMAMHFSRIYDGATRPMAPPPAFTGVQ